MYTTSAQAKELQSFNWYKPLKKLTIFKIPYEIVDRKPGDLATVFADVGRAEQELGWKAGRGIREMCFDSWRFEKNYRE